MNAVQYIEVAGILPIIASIIGVYMKMTNLVSKQEIKIENLEMELKEMKRHNERQEEKMYQKLDSIEQKINEFLIHFSKCRNFKVD
jgi:predicted RNase H-like nuclease (RuvC/YqgF family)